MKCTHACPLPPGGRTHARYCLAHTRMPATAWHTHACPRLPASARQGFEVAKKAVLAFLETFKVPVDSTDREALSCVARTALRTKLREGLADQLTGIVTDAVMCIMRPGEPIDLFMVCGRGGAGWGGQACEGRAGGRNGVWGQAPFAMCEIAIHSIMNQS